MSAEVLSSVGAARRAIVAGALGAQQPTGGGSLSSSVITPPFAAYVLSRIGFAHVEGTFSSIAYFNSLGTTDDERLTAFVDEQLAPTLDGNGNVVDPDVDARLADPAYVTLNKTFDQLWTDYEVNGTLSGQPYVRDYPIREGERAVFVRAIYGRWQLVEQLADFWHNHFNIYGYDRYAAPTWTSWDRDVLRKNMLGNFRAMLQATFESPAMLYFLDNYINRAPSFNENYAREICELHTLGAINYLGPELQQAQVPLIPAGEDGAGMPVGYVDADVYEMARALTGWTFGNGQNGTNYDGHQTFITSWHDIGQKTVLGAFVPANTPPATEIATFLDRIAKHPGTGRHIALQLAQRFIGDDPPQEIVDAAAHVFWLERRRARPVEAGRANDPALRRGTGLVSRRRQLREQGQASVPGRHLGAARCRVASSRSSATSTTGRRRATVSWTASVAQASGRSTGARRTDFPMHRMRGWAAPHSCTRGERSTGPSTRTRATVRRRSCWC